MPRIAASHRKRARLWDRALDNDHHSFPAKGTLLAVKQAARIRQYLRGVYALPTSIADVPLPKFPTAWCLLTACCKPGTIVFLHTVIPRLPYEISAIVPGPSLNYQRPRIGSR